MIHDGAKVVKDSWVIAQHLDAAYPDKPLLPNRGLTRSSSTAGPIRQCNAAVCSRIVVGDLVDRVRPQDKAYIVELRGKRLGTTDFAGLAG